MKTLRLIFLILGCSLCLLQCDIKNKDDDDPNIIDPPDTSEQFPAGWTKVGSLAFNESIMSLTSDNAGNIYAAGNFTNTAGYRYVAVWNGTGWSELGNLKANGPIWSIIATPQNKVYATGDFYDFNGYPYLAYWNGSQWENLAGPPDRLLLATDDAGNIYSGKRKWDGNQWSELFTGLFFNDNIYAVLSNPSGNTQYAAGKFSNGATSNGGYKYVARWNGGVVSETGTLQANNSIHALAMDAQGILYAAGEFTNGENPWTGNRYIAAWDGNTWSEVGKLNANAEISRLAVNKMNSNIYASGNFTNSKGHYYIARWDGNAWADIGSPGMNGAPMTIGKDGKLYTVVAVLKNNKIVFYVVTEK